MMNEALAMWTVYHNPADYPGKFVVRKWEVYGGKAHSTPIVHTGVTVEEVRAQIPKGLYCQPRLEDDEPHIVEVWF